MRQQYSDLRVISAAEQKTIGNKRCWEIDFGYTVSGYEVKDRRVIITTGETTYMFASKEIESNGMLIGSMLDDVVADCELLGPDTDSVLVDSDFMLVTGLSGIYDMFTLKEGTPVRILVSSARIRYYLCEDDLILHEGSGGAPYNFSILCYLKNNRLELATGIVMADSECFEVHEDRESFFTERKPSDRSITREEYYNKMEKMETATVPMELMLF